MKALLAAILLAAAPVASDADLQGRYRTQQMEVAGELLLNADGRFRYALDYGAVSEVGEGRWTADDAGVRLTSDPMPKEPRLALIREEPAPPGQLSLILVGPNGWGGRFKVMVGLQGRSQPIAASVNADGLVELPAGSKPTSIQVSIPIFVPTGSTTSLDPNYGHKLTYRLEPNDFGLAAFRNQPLARADGALVLDRFDTAIRFERVR